MKKNILYIAVALVALVSCVSNPLEESLVVPAETDTPTPGQPFVIHADFGIGTKTDIGNDGKAYWSPGDKIAVRSNRELNVFTSTNTEPATSAEFKGILPVNEFSDDEYYWLLYPVTEDDEYPYNWYETVGGDYLGHLPHEQVGKADGLGPRQDMCAAYPHISELKDVHFQHFVGGVRFSVKEPGITKVTLKALGGEGIAGEIIAKEEVYSNTYLNDNYILYYKVKPVFKDAGYSTIELTPEEGTFVPNKNYYITMRPVTMEKGFSLYLEKGDEWGTRLDINKRVEIRIGEFRTLQECDRNFDWDNTVLSFSKDEFYLEPYSGGFYTKVTCPGPYTIDDLDCDWITEVDPDDWDQPIYARWAYLITSPEQPGGDARYDGCNHVFALKANYGPERSTTVTFRHNGRAYPVTVTQAAGDILPQIKRTHFGCVFHTMDDNQWDWNTDKAFTGYLYNRYENINHADGARLEWAQGAFGSTGSEFPPFVAGQYLYAQNPAIGHNRQFGMLAGDVNLNLYVYDYNNDDEPSLYSDVYVPIMEWAMDEIDEYYFPTTSIAVRANECNEDTREIDVTVEVFAAKAGTYRLTGLIVERQVNYLPGGLLFAASPSNAIIGYVTSYKGDEITFDADNSTKTVTLHAEVPPQSTIPSDWHAPMIAAGYGRWPDLWMLFFTAEQFGSQVQFRMEPNGPTDYYVDNCLYVKFNTLYEHDGGNIAQDNADSGIEGDIEFFGSEEEW